MTPILFQIFHGKPSIGSILVSLVLGFAGFFLIVLLLTMVFVTLARKDQILIASDAVPLMEENENFETHDTDHPQESYIEPDKKIESSNIKTCSLAVLRTMLLKSSPVNDFIQVI